MQKGLMEYQVVDYLPREHEPCVQLSVVPPKKEIPKFNNHQWNSNENHNKIWPDISLERLLSIANAGENAEKWAHLHTAHGSIN